MKLLTPLWYHPSVVVLLDDEPAFLQRLKINLSPCFTPLVHTDPNNALIYLQKWSYKLDELAQVFMKQNGEPSQSPDAQYNQTNISQLSRWLMKDDRFNRIVVAVVDRYMPAVDGLDFCQAVKEKYRLQVKLILLTGATSTHQVVDAFEAGTIDAYVEKRCNPKMLDQINHHLNRLAWDQFQVLSSNTPGNLANQFNYFSDPDFCAAFREISEREEIVEFYLLNLMSGNFILLDRHGAAKLLCIYTDETFEIAIEMAKKSGAPQSVIRSLEERKAYPTNLSHPPDGQAWEERMLPVNKVKGKAIFYQLVSQLNLDKAGYKSEFGF